MSELKLGFSRPWSVRLPIVTRFLDERYVEEFFSSGRLRLPTFSTFRNHKDEERGDPNEGRVNAEINTQNTNHHIFGINGQEAYILCGGLVENPNMEASFTTWHGIRILNLLAFADAVSGRIHGFVGGYQGNCIYRSETFIRKQSSELFEPPANPEDMEKWAKDYDEFVARQTSEAFFIKQLRYAPSTKNQIKNSKGGASSSPPVRQARFSGIRGCWGRLFLGHFLLARQKKVTCCRATPGQRSAVC